MDMLEVQLSLARLEEAVRGGFQRMEEKFDGLAQRQDDLETSGKRQASEAVKLAAKVEVLEGARKRSVAVLRWVGGIVATVAAALVLAKFGLK
jgi:hypothetical protein